ncbi:MAG TPA: PHP domain-containing protein [Acidimicrobiales bacterium]|nr:PHP domain-containing protein [Acidimicrobiales bacterium]
MAAPSAEAVARHPHLATPALPRDAVRVDCHMHTMWSGDSTTTVAELAEAVATSGIDVLCVTDHGTIKGAERLVDELDCRVVIGQEQRTPDGELIGLFLGERIPAGCRSADEAANLIRQQGGLVYVPHPFDPMRHRLTDTALERLAANGLLDVVEVRNAKTSLEHLNSQALAFARRHDLACGAGSDAHVPDAIGAAYVEMTWTGADAASFLTGLAVGRVIGHHFDSARPWRARIVPSVS